RLDAAESFATGATYLRKTGDSICTRDRTTPFPDRTIQQLIADVSGGTDSERVASIWELRARDGVSECVPTLVNQLQHKNPIIRTEALTSLGWLREAALPVVDDLIACTEDRSAEVRGAAAHALGRIGDEPDHVIPYLADLLKDHERSVVTSAVAGLAEYGVLATPASKAIFGVLRQALVRCDYPLADLALAIVTNITKDPLAELEEYFADDEDLRYQVVDQLNALATGEDS
ncbi:MAG: HEAT repeat domain-containing protein, partial [Pirellulaceae bacterium]|nr:HEAT repeat domain-containing protein [Pirellulaceae bacterium]